MRRDSIIKLAEKYLADAGEICVQKNIKVAIEW